MLYGKSFIYYPDEHESAALKDNLNLFVTEYSECLWFYHHHKGEGGDKDHTHIYIVGLKGKHSDRMVGRLFILLGSHLCKYVDPINNLGTAYGYSYHDIQLDELKGYKHEYHYPSNETIFNDENFRYKCQEELNAYLNSKTVNVEKVKECFDKNMPVSFTARILAKGIGQYSNAKQYVADLYNEIYYDTIERKKDDEK